MLALVVVSAVFVALAQSNCDRSYVRSQIEQRGECKNVAITETNGDLMLYGRNGYATTSCCPSGLQNALRELNQKNELIDDVVLTKNGKWLILYGNNGFRTSGCPDDLWDKINGDFSDEVVNSVTFNDKGEWIIITENYFSSSSAKIQSWLKKGNEQYGQLWAACITNDAMVAVYANGYQYQGNVPEDLKEALSKSKLDVFRIKIAGSSWFYADEDGSYSYSM